MITTSLDGSWAAARRGREVLLLERGAGPVVGKLALESEDVDVAMLGVPSALLVVARGPSPRVTMYQPPDLEAAARIDLPVSMRLAAVTGPRAVLVSSDGKKVLVVRTAPRALAASPIDPGGVVELAVGLERNQVLFSLPKKLEVWDAVSSRPLLRLQIQLPPPPRTVGAAQGHLWATRPGSDEVYVYRLSDGRPFRHHAGSPIESVVSHPASPLLVLVTARGLVRLHCFAHSLSVVDAPWTPGVPLAQIGSGEDMSLVGWGPGDAAPWRVSLAGTASVPVAEPGTADRPRDVRPQAGGESPPEPVTSPRARAWRDPLAAYGHELVRGNEAEAPLVPVDTELGDLVHRLHLGVPARRALTALYALYLVGEPMVALARIAQILGDWTEPLGQGDLHALGMLRKERGRAGLEPGVTDLLDGAPSLHTRLVGTGPRSARPGAWRIPREGRRDAELEAELVAQLGLIAIVDGDLAGGLLEARVHGAVAVALASPSARPLRWPRETALVVVAEDGAPAWVAALPALT